MDEATWAALAAALTVAGLIWTWVAFRRRGAANGLRAMGFAVLPAAAWLTGTLEMVTEVAGSVTDWATGLVLDPRTWTGIALAGLAVVLWVISGVLRDRQLARAQRGGDPAAGVAPGKRGRRGKSPSAEALPPSSQSSTGPVLDDDLDDIEALLRRRGIS